MEIIKKYKSLFVAALIFCIADVFRMRVLFGTMPYIEVRTLADWLGIAELLAAVLMVKETAGLAKASKNRFYYIPLVCYCLYGFYFATKVFVASSLLYRISGNDILRYYKMYVLLAELCIGIRVWYRGKEKKIRIAGICLIAINLLLSFALRFSYGVSWIGQKYTVIAGIVYSILSVSAHLLVVAVWEKLKSLEKEEGKDKDSNEKNVSRKGSVKPITSCILVTALLLNGCSAVERRTSELFVSQDEIEEPANNDFFSDDGRKLEQRIVEYINTVSKDDYNGSVLITYQDMTLYEEAFGYANAYASLESERYNGKDQLYNIGGTTRQFTAAAILLLQEQGLLNLDDTIDQYISDYRYGSEITIRQLLNQTSGIIDYTDAMGKVTDILQYLYGQDLFGIAKHIDGRHSIVRLINSFPLQSTPGEVNETSASNYFLLGMIIERVSKEEYFDYISQNILEPLGMEDSTFDINRCSAYAYDGQNIGMIYSPYFTYSDTGFCSTTQDMLKWQKGLFDGKILSEQSLKQMLTMNEISEMGYGWRENGEGYYYLTCDNGYYTYQYVNTEKNLHVTVLFNTFGGVGMKVLIDMTDYIVDYLDQGGAV